MIYVNENILLSVYRDIRGKILLDIDYELDSLNFYMEQNNSGEVERTLRELRSLRNMLVNVDNEIKKGEM